MLLLQLPPVRCSDEACAFGPQALLPLFAPQLTVGGFPAGLLASTGALLAGLGPAMWHMWIYLGSANANFYYAITLLFGAWQARPAIFRVSSRRLGWSC